MISKSCSESKLEVVGYSTNGNAKYPIVVEEIEPVVYYYRGDTYATLDSLIEIEEPFYDFILLPRYLNGRFPNAPIVFKGEFNSGSTDIGSILLSNGETNQLVKDKFTEVFGMWHGREYVSIGTLQDLLELSKKGSKLTLHYSELYPEEVAAVREFCK